MRLRLGRRLKPEVKVLHSNFKVRQLCWSCIFSLFLNGTGKQRPELRRVSNRIPSGRGIYTSCNLAD